tara:strand:+ start:125 stop:427 length:303 start_codon:yes stop_codon:yes gene_type:complete
MFPNPSGKSTQTKKGIRNMNTTTNVTLLDTINEANEAQVDSLWAILKYKEIGIYRKIACMCEVLGLDFDSAIEGLPQDEEGRVLDYKTRHLIHDTLIGVS